MRLFPLKLFVTLALSGFLIACSSSPQPQTKPTTTYSQQSERATTTTRTTARYKKPHQSKPQKPNTARSIFLAEGLASYYGKRFHGRKTASGERFNMHQLTAAHKKLPFGTRVRVTNLKNNRSVIVIINDRGPFAKKRIIDLSRAAAQRIGMIKDGVVPVKVETLL